MQKHSNSNALALFLLIGLVFFGTGCLTNPTTGKLGPSWQVPVRIPLLANKTSITELIQDELELSPTINDILQAKLSFADTLHVADFSFDLKPIKSDIKSTDIKFPVDKTLEFTVKTTINTTGLLEHGKLESISFNGGTAHLSFNNDVDSDVQIKSITINEKTYTSTSIPLAGLTLTKNDEIEISGKAPINNHNIKQLKLSFDIKTSDIASLSGRNLRLKLPHREIPFDFEFPTELENLEFRYADLFLTLDYVSAINEPPQIELKELAVTGLSIPAAAEFTGHGEFRFTPHEVVDLLNQRPKQVAVGGHITVGSSSLATISIADRLDLNFRVELPLEFNMTRDIIYETEVFPLNLTDLPFDTIEDLTRSIRAELEIDYRLPAGFNVAIYLSNEEEPLHDQNAIVLQTAIESSSTNEGGMATADSYKQVAIEVPTKVNSVLQQQAYAQMLITIPAPSSNRITFSSHDHANVKAWLEILAKVNK